MPYPMIYQNTPGLGVEKLCRCCKEFWPLDAEFWHKTKKSPDGYRARCIACTLEQMAGYRAGLQNPNPPPAKRASSYQEAV